MRLPFSSPSVWLFIVALTVSVSATFAVPRCNVDRPSAVSTCHTLLVESIPENLTYLSGSPTHMSTIAAWQWLLQRAQTNLYLAEFYWTLLAEKDYNFSAAIPGKQIFDQLIKKAKQIKIKIAQNGSPSSNPELAQLAEAGAQIFWIDVAKLLGTGIVHTKMWSVDGKHGYLGSANMDWRALTEVKELGVLFANCPSLMEDMNKIHYAYWLVEQGVPHSWPSHLMTEFNLDNPMRIKLNGFSSHVYFSSSPTDFNPPGRTYDLDAILSVIRRANKFVYVAVMNYSPEIVHYNRKEKNQFWPVIDDALRSAAIDRGVEVRLLVSSWNCTPATMSRYLQSLRALNGIQDAIIRVRYFVVPAFTEEQKRIPFARVNHNKYMVTDRTGYIGTSNWSGDYFIKTAGVGFVFEHNETDRNDCILNGQMPLRQQLQQVFERDWNSPYTVEL